MKDGTFHNPDWEEYSLELTPREKERGFTGYSCRGCEITVKCPPNSFPSLKTHAKGTRMADNQQCSDPNPHGPHTWYSPAPQKGNKTVQIQHNCPGVSKK